MVAAAWKNDALLREMMDKDMAAVEKSSFNSAHVCDTSSLNFLRVSQSCPEYSSCFFVVFLLFFCSLPVSIFNGVIPMLFLIPISLF